jgi:peptidoglycan/LPS O-acetylase OafA/YrhL
MAQRPGPRIPLLPAQASEPLSPDGVLIAAGAPTPSVRSIGAHPTMTSNGKVMRTSYALVLLPALAGLALGAIAYFGPNGNTGVDGTPGALLALIGAAAVTLGALLAMRPAVRGWSLGLLNFVLALGLVLVAAAAYFLMQHAFAVAMALALVGLVAALALRRNRKIA